MVQIESTNGFSKGGCYLLAAMCWLLGLLAVRNTDLQQQPATGWGILLVLVLGGIVPLLWYAASLKRFRLTLTREVCRLEQLPDILVAEQPMAHLLRWSVRQPTRRPYNSLKVLSLHFRLGDPVCIDSLEYPNMQRLEEFLQRHYPQKQKASSH
ncbi:hypothetical protein [Hymenobacter sp. B81]|uniref:hypothetical protein n=1 Tax=Hymenobacter sp. B81 TaxID=3344878 RepID=UPI0037DCADFC